MIKVRTPLFLFSTTDIHADRPDMVFSPPATTQMRIRDAERM